MSFFVLSLLLAWHNISEKKSGSWMKHQSLFLKLRTVIIFAKRCKLCYYTYARRFRPLCHEIAWYSGEHPSRGPCIYGVRDSYVCVYSGNSFHLYSQFYAPDMDLRE